jgi:hypothetical protein
MSTDTENVELYVSNFVLVKLVVYQKKIHLNLIKNYKISSHGLEPGPETFRVIYIGNHVLRINLKINDYSPEQHLPTAFVMKK